MRLSEDQYMESENLDKKKELVEMEAKLARKQREWREEAELRKQQQLYGEPQLVCHVDDEFSLEAAIKLLRSIALKKLTPEVIEGRVRVSVCLFVPKGEDE